MSINADGRTFSPQASQNPGNFSTRKTLSCTSCRDRKIKCDKAIRCGPCLELGLKCVYPTRRVRASRAQRIALRARDEELLDRISHLESLLANKANAGVVVPTEGTLDAPSTPAFGLPQPRNGEPGQAIGPGIAVNDHYVAFVKQQGSSSRHLNSRFWSSLSKEFDDLRGLIEGGVADDDDFDEWDSTSPDATGSSPDLMFEDLDKSSDLEAVHPNDTHSAVLFRVYFKNVDPVCKILHRPTVNAYFSNMSALYEPSTRRFKFRSLEAVTFAVYFAAVISMSAEECLMFLGEDKNLLSARYKRSVELALVQADFLNALEITTLQALTIYTMARRPLSRGRSNWALAGLAVRIAQSLGLHQDGDGQAFSAFEAEMRRRLFWQILALDMRASEDRGSEPSFTEHSFNTAMPCNLNDADFGHDSQHPLHSRTGHTEMTLCLLEMDALCTGWKINLGLPADEPRKLTFLEKANLIKDYVQRIELTYLANCRSVDQKTKLLHAISHFWIYKLWLILYYPLRHQATPEQTHSSNQGLQTAVKILKGNELIEQYSSPAGFTWLFKTYAPWHAVAVALAEICNQPHHTVADSAWNIIQSHFNDWSGRFVGTKEAMLWGPIKNLLKRARVARQNSQEQVEAQPELSDLSPDLSEVTAFASSNPDQHMSNEGFRMQSFNDFHLLDQGAGQPLDDFTFAPFDLLPGNSVPPGTSSNLDEWNGFTFDVNALNGEYFPGSYAI